MITQAIKQITKSSVQKLREKWICARWNAYLEATGMSDNQAQLETLKMAEKGLNVKMEIEKQIRPNYPELALPFEYYKQRNWTP